MIAPPVLIFDFDGTVSLGDGPVLAYAAAIADVSGLAPGFVADVRCGLAEQSGAHIDGYDLVRDIATERGVTARELAAGYRASRAELGTAAAPVTAPAGLAAFLRETAAERMLVTNAPDTRLAEALAALGLTGLFDRIVTDAAKPAGLRAVLTEFAPDRRVMSVGDVWQNDLAPAAELGFATAHVGGWLPPGAAPSIAGATVSELLPDLARWVAGDDLPQRAT